jgi:hypothetical protein
VPDIPARPNRHAWLLQLGVVVAALLLVRTVPTSGAPMLLVPLTPSARAGLVRLAVDAGATLGALGPFPGSVVVRADRPGFLGRMIASGVVPLAADAVGCSSTGERG